MNLNEEEQEGEGAKGHEETEEEANETDTDDAEGAEQECDCDCASKRCLICLVSRSKQNDSKVSSAAAKTINNAASCHEKGKEDEKAIDDKEDDVEHEEKGEADNEEENEDKDAGHEIKLTAGAATVLWKEGEDDDATNENGSWARICSTQAQTLQANIGNSEERQRRKRRKRKKEVMREKMNISKGNKEDNETLTMWCTSR